MRRLIYIIIGVIVLGCICTGCENKSLSHQLDELDTLMRVNPDSVYAVLDSMDTRKMSKHQRMRHALLLADAQNKAYIDFTTDSIMLEVADYFDKHGTSNEQMRVHYLLGCTYRDLKDVPMELQCFLDATEKADTTKVDCDLYTLCAIYGQMANIYHSQYLPLEELKALDMCKIVAMQDKDTLSAIKAYELRVRPFYLLDNKDSVLFIAKKAYDHYIMLGKCEKASRLLPTVIDILMKDKKYDKAKYYLNVFEEYVCHHADSLTLNKTTIINYDKGLLFLIENKNDSALSCFNKLLMVGEKEAAYHGLLSLYEKIHQPDSIAKYAKLFAEANDSSYVGKNSEVIAQMTAMYNYGRQEKIAKEKTIESTKAKNMICTISVIAFLVLVSLLATIAILKYRSEEKERIHKEQENLLLKRYNETKETISKLEKEKENLLTDNANIDQLLQIISQFEEEKQELETKLREFNQITDDVDFKAWYENFINCNAANKLHAKTIVSVNSTVKVEDELWEELRRHIKMMCPGFLNILDAYSLNPTYQKIVLLNTFDFTNSEISILFDKTSQQISNIHNRISKKMFPSSKDTRKLKQNIQAVLRGKRI